MAIKTRKVALLEVFHHTAKRKFIEKLADMFDRFECGYCDTTRFHKNRPQEVSPLISFQSVLNLSASGDGPFSQGKPTTTWQTA